MTTYVLKNRKTGEVRRCRLVDGGFGTKFYEAIRSPGSDRVSVTLSTTLVDPDGTYRDRTWKVVRTATPSYVN